MRNVCGCWHSCILESIRELLQPLREISQAVSHRLLVGFLLFGFWVLGGSRRFPDVSSSLLKRAGLEEVLDESCGDDVEDELAQELDDNPGTTTGTKVSVLCKMFFPL